MSLNPTIEDDGKSVDGLDVIDCTRIQIGNADIPVPEYVPTVVTPGTSPLPVYPAQSNLPEKLS